MTASLNPERLVVLIGKLAPALFVESEGGGHDLGLWLDSGDIDEDEYELIRSVLP